VALGVMDDLSEVKSQTRGLQPGVANFTRLNVSRAVREAELADLAGQHTASDAAVA
jgi:hypothetical protein